MTETEAKPKPDPKGVIAIWTDPDGDVIATASDFNRSGYGGFKLWEAQRMRCKQSVTFRAISAYCAPAVSDALSPYLVEQITNAMRNKGHKVTCRAVGWSEDIAAEIAQR